MFFAPQAFSTARVDTLDVKAELVFLEASSNLFFGFFSLCLEIDQQRT